MKRAKSRVKRRINQSFRDKVYIVFGFCAVIVTLVVNLKQLV
jgi:hypothetical protein